MKIITVVGARPQFIKAAAVSRAFRTDSSIEEIIIHTGQHYDANMSDVFFDEMDIPKPKYQLDVNGLGHGAMTGQMLEKIEKVLLEEKPDWVLVYGDTNSTLAGALAAKKLHFKVAHVEAGLRSFNIRMPEEINRILTDRISNILLCPTQTAIDNLDKEGYANIDAKIDLTGDVMYDAALFYQQQSEAKSTVMKSLNLSKEFILCTIHRAENTDDPSRLKAILSALETLNQDCEIVLPIHPRTAGILRKMGIQSNLKLIDPVGYFDMIQLLSNCSLVLTDSGGLQKEAFYFDKYCITMRDETEWVELVSNGFNFIAGADEQKIVALAKEYMGKAFPTDAPKLYGDGKASFKIMEAIKNY